MDICINCGVSLVKGANYCHVCGNDIKLAETKYEEMKNNGEIPFYSCAFQTQTGIKEIEVWCQDINKMNCDIDLLTVSVFRNDYNAKDYPKSMIGALYYNRDIDIQDLHSDKFLDLTALNGCWLSYPLVCTENNPNIKRIGCIQFPRISNEAEEFLAGVKGYIDMLNLVADAGVDIGTVVLPVVGTGSQHIDFEIVLIPLISEILRLLDTNERVKKVILVDRNAEKVERIAETFRASYQIASFDISRNNRKEFDKPMVFISYNKNDIQVAELIVDELKKRSIDYWFAPEDIVSGVYASEIVNAIDRSTHFICIISANSMKSHHVLNEINLAFSHLKDGLIMLPFKIDAQKLDPAFKYYLSTIQCTNATNPPMIARAKEFVDMNFRANSSR
ncbi:MAG: toll/interleukin-1 receptor domain-containing protein [Clostridia bacterium]|nr:toll/interleukin-1 receptor domain-containing protein [Clostridia bacterium]